METKTKGTGLRRIMRLALGMAAISSSGRDLEPGNIIIPRMPTVTDAGATFTGAPYFPGKQQIKRKFNKQRHSRMLRRKHAKK